MKYLFPTSLLIVVLVFSCKKDKDEPTKESNFASTEEYIKNPSVTAAITELGININEGDNPPPLAGTYLTDGEVVDASDLINTLIGYPISSEIRLYNQTTSGKIDFQEKVGGLTAWGSGGYITGDNGSFTIWQESEQSGSDAGLPDDITINVALLMSGTKLTNGDLTAKGISIITKVETDNSQYNAEILKGIWWMWDAYFELQTGTKSSDSRPDNIKSCQSVQGILRRIIEQAKTQE